MTQELYVISAREGQQTVYWRGDWRWTTEIDSALRIGGYNVAVPIAGVLGLILGEKYSLITPKYVPE